MAFDAFGEFGVVASFAVEMLGRSDSGAGKATSEFADEGDSEQSPRQLDAVSNTCSCCGEAVNV